jgi:hypothetical protein
MSYNKEYHRKYYERNKEKCNKQSHEGYLRNKDKVLAKKEALLSTEEGRELQKKWGRNSYQKNKAKKKVYQQIFYSDPKHREERSRKNRLRYQQLRRTCVEHYGNSCACCGESREPFLAIDHINNDGAKQRKKDKLYAERFYKWLIHNNFPEGYRILCHNCNMAIGLLGSCPHEKERLGLIQTI